MLTVITHTKFERPELLERCKASVAAALPEGAQHLVIECPDRTTWNRRRVSDAIDHDIVAFVDDDDYVHPDAFKLCLRAMEESGLGAACTDEVIVYLDNTRQYKSTGQKTYLDSTVHPRVVHHVCTMRGNLIDSRSVEFNDRFGVGIDWFIRESVILQYGCIYVPMYGYYWTQHPGQHTIHSRQLYQNSMRSMQQLIRETWLDKFKGPLPVFDQTSF
jgi:glycosyltransferase involved in cell wall biosynthesis